MRIITDNNKSWGGCRELGLLYITGRNKKWYSRFGKQCGSLNTVIPLQEK